MKVILWEGEYGTATQTFYTAYVQQRREFYHFGLV